MDEFLRQFVEDVNKLSENGITVNVDGQVRHYKVALLAFLADNLAAHQAGGFKESMSFALQICRSCMATKTLTQTPFS